MTMWKLPKYDVVLFLFALLAQLDTIYNMYHAFSKELLVQFTTNPDQSLPKVGLQNKQRLALLYRT